MTGSWYQSRIAAAGPPPLPPVFYHGTASSRLPAILSEGLKNPHFCDDPERARYWADVAASDDGGEPVLITVPSGRIDPSKLMIDRTSMDEPVLADDEARDDAWSLAAEEHPEWYDRGTGTVSIPDSRWEYSWFSVGAVRYGGAVPVAEADVSRFSAPVRGVSQPAGWYRTAAGEAANEPWQMTREEFMDFHRTGWISPEAYKQYRTLEGVAWLGPKSKYPILHSKGVFGGREIEFRQTGRKLQYVKENPAPEPGEDFIMRDGHGLALYLSEEEMDRRGLHKFDTTIVAFDGDTPVGWGSDEFGTIGVWVAEPYQRKGIGTWLLREMSRTFPGRRMGQMTDAGRAAAFALHRRLVEEAAKEGRPVPPEVLDEYPGLRPAGGVTKAAWAEEPDLPDIPEMVAIEAESHCDLFGRLDVVRMNVPVRMIRNLRPDAAEWGRLWLEAIARYFAARPEPSETRKREIVDEAFTFGGPSPEANELHDGYLMPASVAYVRGLAGKTSKSASAEEYPVAAAAMAAGRIFEGRTHAEALQKALDSGYADYDKDGDLIDKDGKPMSYDGSVDLFRTNKGRIISRLEAYDLGEAVAAEDIPEQQVDTLEKVILRHEVNGLDVSVHEGKDSLVLQTLRVPRGKRDTGLGIAFMEDLCAYADRVGKRVELNLGEREPGETTSKRRLISFCRRFGFVRNFGRTVNDALSCQMYRKPRPARRAKGGA